MAGGEEGEVSQGYNNPSLALTLAHAVDEACYHQDGVEVPLLLQVLLQNPPEGEGQALGVPPVLDDPVESEGQLPV